MLNIVVVFTTVILCSVESSVCPKSEVINFLFPFCLNVLGVVSLSSEQCEILICSLVALHHLFMYAMKQVARQCPHALAKP